MEQSLRAPFILVATPQIGDPSFERSVILIVEYHRQGAMGFRLNRPETIPLKEIISLDETTIPDNIPTWNGGPVDNESGIILHASNLGMGGKEPEWANSFALTSSEDALRKLVRTAEDTTRKIEEARSSGKSDPRISPLYPYRFMVGHCGWGPSQLDEEIKDGFWMQRSVTSNFLFDTPWHEMWNVAMKDLGVNPASYTSIQQAYAH